MIPGPSTNLLLAFSPVSLGSGKAPTIYEKIITSAPKETLKLPTDSSFFTQKLSHRYRNSRSIQELTLFIGKDMKKYLALDEVPETDAVGEKPIWMDIADEKELLRPALEHIKKCLENDKKNQKILLFDKNLSLETKNTLENIKEPRSKGGFAWDVMEERLFHGSECDTVIYVGSGHLEAFTRARLKLFIITLAEKTQNVATGNDNSWYMQYQDSLAKAAEKELVNLIKKTIFHPMDT